MTKENPYEPVEAGDWGLDEESITEGKMHRAWDEGLLVGYNQAKAEQAEIASGLVEALKGADAAFGAIWRIGHPQYSGIPYFTQRSDAVRKAIAKATQ